MKFLYNLRELLTLRTNAWVCSECDRAYVDMSYGVYKLVNAGDENCRHRKLERAIARTKE